MTYSITSSPGDLRVASCNTCGWASPPMATAGMAGSLFDQHNERDHNMTHHTLIDDFGRRTVFLGAQLVDEHTDTEEGRKPQWLEVTIWRTEAGNFVVRRTTRYRIIHASESCSRAEGYVLVEAGEEDTYNCNACNKHGDEYTEGWAQAPRITVDVYTTPTELIESFRSEGRYSNLARSILSDLAKLDEGIDSAWSVVHVA